MLPLQSSHKMYMSLTYEEKTGLVTSYAELTCISPKKLLTLRGRLSFKDVLRRASLISFDDQTDKVFWFSRFILYGRWRGYELVILRLVIERSYKSLTIT